ncbi:MAG: peptidoglycan-binding protein [Acidobacteriota bacterium]|nr:peptidoglycan-binding protein [Acidobacteriota bacterium]
MRLLAVAFVGVSLVAANAVQTPATKKKAAPKSTKATAAHGAPAAVKSRAGTAKSGLIRAGASNSTTKAGTKSKRVVVARRPPVQMQPSTDRYKEIQQALAGKGYFRGMPDGTWGSESVDALKRFQKDQNLDPDGKIGSLSLMALGLGPKRGLASAQSAPSGSEPVDPRQ